jgi:hypothetical protein
MAIMSNCRVVVQAPDKRERSAKNRGVLAVNFDEGAEQSSITTYAFAPGRVVSGGEASM